jgi:hypothetical protein
MLEDDLKEMVRAAVGMVPRQAGADEVDVRSTELRLGTALPPILRRFYVATGQLPAVMRSFHTFVPLHLLEFHQDGLVFCRDHQDQIFWATLRSEVEAEDPPVVQGQRNSSTWYPHSKKTSTFLVNMACWQLVNGMPSVASASLEPGTVSTLRKHMRVVSAAFGFDMISFVAVREGLLASALLNIGRVYIAGRTDEALRIIEGATGIELDWA